MNNGIIVAIGIAFIFVMTSLGAMVVLLFGKPINDRMNAIFLAIASGVMMAASIWSLILPSIAGSEHMGKWSFIPALAGIIMGSMFILALDRWIKVDLDDESSIERGKMKKLFIAVTVHNVPEGLAVGFAFGSAIAGSMDIMFALMLAIGIGVQNFPEGAALSLPIKGATGSKYKGLMYGVLSGVPEPITALIGFYLAKYILSLQPYLLSFAAGAMMFVVIEDLLPEAVSKAKSSIVGIFFTFGFLLMMLLDVALG